MKRVLLTSVSLAALSLVAPALGADLPAYKAAARVSPEYDWSGFYVGVFGGGGFGNHNINNGTPTGFANALFTYDSTGGIAYALTDNLSAKFEYRYFNFGTFSRTAPTNGLAPYTDTTSYNILTVGLDFKFGGGGPVVAKY
jgi:opacity protein-like surface antigen